MNLELLPNETILDLFEYLSIIDLFHAFFDLNTRFNQLLCFQFHHFHLDLRLLSKTQCHQICQNYVSLILNRILSFHFSNDDDSPQQIELFLSHHSQLRQFTRLQSISLSDIRSPQTLDQILLECTFLPCLTHITLTNCHISMNQSDADRFFNHIWGLTNLTYCNFKIWFAHGIDFSVPIVTSLSLRHLIAPRPTCSVSNLARLSQNTPNLEYLSISFTYNSDELKLTSPILSITRLEIRFIQSIDILEHLLQNMPNLSHLTLDAYNVYIDGYQWEKIIRKYLPKLKLFQFQLNFRPLNNKDEETQLNEILESYRTKFWVDEHQWFVRCHWYEAWGGNQRNHLSLFTLPYPFGMLSPQYDWILAKSTCPYDDEYLTCDRVIFLTDGLFKVMGSLLSRVRFPNIQHLSLRFPFDDQFLSVVSKLDQLTRLEVSVYKNENLENIESQLQFLLDQTPYLRSLRFAVRLLSRFQMSMMKITSDSVRELNLKSGGDKDMWLWYDDEQCVQLSRSFLGIQCKTLLIDVKNRRNVLDLVNNMPNLRALNVRCGDDDWTNQNKIVPSAQDELVEWLRSYLPISCTITRDANDIHDIRLWIR